MILFLDENGNTFNGVAPYIHWINGQLSVGLWYTLKLMILSDSSSLQTSELDSDSIFKFIDPQYYVDSPTDLDLTVISTNQITSIGAAVEVDGNTWYVHQILLVCESDAAGEFIEEFTIGNDVVKVGVDLYDENESLSINLSNRGLDLPVSIQKAFLVNNIHEDYTDFALINRKFKELVSNFIDIVDNKGSYKSLYNSLKWFEWGEGTKLYEIWKNDNMFLEKELTPILSEIYHDLLYTYQKTTHLSLVASLQSISDEEVDEERNPVLEDIAYQWSVNDLALKVSILGAFFERYFMPIHLDLRRACAEAMVFTHQVKGFSGTHTDRYHYHNDDGVVYIEMDHTVVLGNIPFVAVGEDTMFAKRVTPNMYDEITFINPVGVEPISEIKTAWDPSVTPSTEGDVSDEIATFYTQLKGGVGVIVPIKVTVDLPEDDGLITEILTLYGWNGDEIYKKENPIIERRLIKPTYDELSKKWKASFSFNLVSTQEEKVSFSLALYSLSGHTWTVVSSYEVVDVSGSYLDICMVENASSSYNNIEDWINQKNNPYSKDNKDPYARLYEYIDLNPIDPDHPDVRYPISDESYNNVLLTQYIPYSDDDLTQFNQLIVIENNLSESIYDTSWESSIESMFWIFHRAGEEEYSGDNSPRYSMLISKASGVQFINRAQFLASVGGLTNTNIKRFDNIFIPQLHKYTPLESRGVLYDNYCFDETDLLCVFPQFKKNVHISHVSWKFKNMTTLEEFELSQPQAIPLVANSKHKLLSKGFWTVTMYYKLDGSSELHELKKNSAFKLI